MTTVLALAPLYHGEDAVQVCRALAQVWAEHMAVDVEILEDCSPEEPGLSRSTGHLRLLTTRCSLFEPPTQAVVSKTTGNLPPEPAEGGLASKGGVLSQSIAETAMQLNAPLVLVLDVSGTARTAAALALGCRAFEPRLNLAGVICTRSGSERHMRALQAAMQEIDLPLFGCLPRQAGLRPPNAEQPLEDDLLARVKGNLDLDALLAVAGELSPSEPAAGFSQQDARWLG